MYAYLLQVGKERKAADHINTNKQTRAADDLYRALFQVRAGELEFELRSSWDMEIREISRSRASQLLGLTMPPLPCLLGQHVGIVVVQIRQSSRVR